MQDLQIDELRTLWENAWGRKPRGTMGRTMMIESLRFKKWQKETGGLKPEQQKRLSHLIKTYKRNPDTFENTTNLKPGTRLVRKWKSKTYSVTVKTDGFEYAGKTYASLSKVANDITGSKWNGWVFFGLKKAGAS